MARISLLVLVVLLAAGSIGSFVMAGRARTHAEDAAIGQARAAVENTLSNIFVPSDLVAPVDAEREQQLDAQLAVALGATYVGEVTLFNSLGTVLYDTLNDRIGNKLIGERGAIRTALRGGAVTGTVGETFTVLLPLGRGSSAAVQVATPRGPIDGAGNPWTLGALLLALAAMIAGFLTWWIGRITAAAGSSASFVRPASPREETPRRRVALTAAAATPIAAPAPYGLKEEADARRQAEDRARAAEERLTVLQEQYRNTLEELRTAKDHPPVVASDRALEERVLRAEGQIRLLEGQLKATGEERDGLAEELRKMPSPSAGKPNPQHTEHIRKLEQEMIGLRAELEGTQTELSMARRELEATKAGTAKDDEAVGRQTERIRELEQDLDAAQVRILSSQETLEAAQTDVEASHAEVAQLRNVHEQELRERESRLHQASQETVDLRRELETAKALAGEETEVVRAHADLARQLQEELESLRDENRVARELLDDAQHKLHASAEELRDTRLASSTERQQLEAAIAERDDALAERRTSADDHETALQREREALADARTEIQAAEAKAGDALVQAEEARAGLLTQADRIRELQEELETARAEALRTGETAGAASAQARTAQAELEDARKELRALRNEEQRAAMLEDELRAARAELESAKASHRAELIEREADLEQKVRATREEFQTGLAGTTDELSTARTELDGARGELERTRQELTLAQTEVQAELARGVELADRAERAERELHAQQAAARKAAKELDEAVEANADLARKLQDVDNRRQLELADDEGRAHMDDILYATQERLAGQTEKLMEAEDRAHGAEREAADLGERLDEVLAQLRQHQMSEALKDLRGDDGEAPTETVQIGEAAEFEDRRASSPFLKELSLDAKKSLSQILGLTQILKHKKDAKDQAQLVKQLTAYARRLDLTVSDLADADKLANGTIELNVRRTDLEALVNRVVAESDIGADHDVRIVSEQLVVGIDQLRTEQVLAGLLRSSGDRTPAGKSILVTMQHVSGGALITVADPEPSSDASLSPVVKRFAEVQGGWAKVETREDGAGSLFRVFLPDANAPAGTDIGPEFTGDEQPSPAAADDLHIVVDRDGDLEQADSQLLVQELHRLSEVPKD